jgi:hypothetical protein
MEAWGEYSQSSEIDKGLDTVAKHAFVRNSIADKTLVNQLF